MKCEVTSNITHDVMISTEIGVPSTYKDICRGEPRKVNIGYNNYGKYMWVENNTLTSTPPQKFIHGKDPQISQTWEVLSKFFSLHNIEPNWLDCNFTYGHYDEELGGWTGCLGQVRGTEF